MKIFLIAVSLVTVIFSSQAQQTQPAPSGQKDRHVVLITVDGFRPDFYLDPSWNTPNLQQLKKDGVFADGVNSVFPSMTYPSHTTIVTGVHPAQHGIYFNNMFEPNGPTGKMYWND